MRHPEDIGGIARLIGRPKVWWLMLGILVGLWAGWLLHFVR